mgnify:CR=1 FL=1
MQTTAKDRDTRFWDKSAEKYAAQKVADEETYRIKLERTGALFTPEMTVMEFGCGTGTTARLRGGGKRHRCRASPRLGRSSSGEILRSAACRPSPSRGHPSRQ